MSRRATVLFRGGEVRVLDVRCTCAAGRADEEAPAGFEVVLPLAGLFRRRTALGRPATVDAGSGYVTLPGQPHTVEHGTAGDRCHAVLVSDRLADEIGLDAVGGRGGALGRPAATDAAIARVRTVAGQAEELAVEELVVRLLSGLAERPSTDARPPTAQQRAGVERVRQAVAAAPGAAWSLRSLAGIAGYAPHHLSRLFARVTGTTLAEHRDRVRTSSAFAAACDGLLLADVAATFGYADHSHLTRSMRRRYGVVPSQLRG